MEDLIYIALGLLAVVLTAWVGRVTALFEVMLIFDTAKDWLGWNWSKEDFGGTKDENHDGKISWFEYAFAKDNGHKTKRWAILFRYLSGFLLAFTTLHFTKDWLVYTPLEFRVFIFSTYAILMLWVIESTSFAIHFQKYRYLPKNNTKPNN